jgi:methylmalonyl-CoA/ethylmalonyl-CoA epimerase
MNLKFHHIGYISSNIDKWEKGLLFEKKIRDVFDPVQQARLCLYQNFSSSHIELIQPLNEDAFTWNSLIKKGNHFNHLCYQVNSKQELEKVVVHYRLIEILRPVPALLFENKLVTFYFTRNQQIVEFLITENESQDFI